MGKKTPAAPATPDYRGAAVEQGAANLEAARATARLSNPNTYTPYGTQLVSYDGDVPTIRQTLTPTAQKTLEAQQGVELSLANLGAKGANTASGVLDKPFSFGGPDVQTSLDLSGIAKMPVNAGMTGQEAIMQRLEPSLARQRTSTETQLIYLVNKKQTQDSKPCYRVLTLILAQINKDLGKRLRRVSLAIPQYSRRLHKQSNSVNCH